MQAGHGGLRPRRAILALAVVGCAVLFGAGSPAHAGGGATTTLPNDVVHNLGLATLTGSVPATQTVTVGVFLSNPNQAAEDAYAKQLYDPSSPNYGNYLDPGTFNAEFGVPAATFQAAQSWLQADGLTVTSVEGATDYMLASGTRGAGRGGVRHAAQHLHRGRPELLREHAARRRCRPRSGSPTCSG